MQGRRPEGRSHRARIRDRAYERRRAIATTIVFAKLSPPQKAKVIEALHRKGHVVGYLGDGINDGPALKTADVGISVDTAVDIAKESADIILLEKNLLVLDDGVIEGRKVFANITKYIKMGARWRNGPALSKPLARFGAMGGALARGWALRPGGRPSN